MCLLDDKSHSAANKIEATLLFKPIYESVKQVMICMISLLKEGILIPTRIMDERGGNTPNNNKGKILNSPFCTELSWYMLVTFDKSTQLRLSGSSQHDITASQSISS